MLKIIKISTIFWSCCWKSASNCLKGLSHKLWGSCSKQSYGFLVLTLKWYWQVLLSFQNYLICLSLTSCSVYESHTLGCNFCIEAIICYIILPVWVYLAKKRSTARKKVIHFGFPLLWLLLQLYHSPSVRWDHYYMSWTVIPIWGV